MDLDRSIVIVGGGPSGLAAAIWAKRAAIAANVDLPVTVLEQRSRSSDAPVHGTNKPWGTRFNALSISASSLHSLAALGVDFGRSTEATRWTHNEVHFPDGVLLRPVKHRLAAPGKASQACKGAWVFPHVANIRLGTLEHRLLKTAESLDVAVVFGTRVTGFSDFPEGTVVEALTSDGAPKRFPTWLCIIADGSSKAHQQAVLRKSGNADCSSCGTLIDNLGIEIELDAPDLGRFIASPFQLQTEEPGLHATLDEINGLMMLVDSRFDMPCSSTMVQVRLPNDVNLSRADKLGWLAWAASRHDVKDSVMLQEPVEFFVSATHTRQNVSRNPSVRSGISGAKLLIGMARASTPQTNGAGFQVTGLVDGFAIGIMLQRILTCAKSEREALAHYETGRNNAARMLARRHSSDTPITGLRAMREKDFDRLVHAARTAGYRGEQPHLA
ncbi:MAG: hypothetical protein AAFN27_07865 [Pseudomonadota bacterium]